MRIGRRFGQSTAIPFAGLAWFSSLPVVRCGSGQSLCSAIGSAGWSPSSPDKRWSPVVFIVLSGTPVSAVARQLAGVGLGLSFGSRRAPRGAFGTAAHRAHPRRRDAAKHAVWRRVQCLLCPDIAADSRGLFSSATPEERIHRFGSGRDSLWEDLIVPWLRWQSVVDFFVLTTAFYALLRWAHSTRALRIGLGVVGIHALSLLARHFDLVITSWVLDAAAILAVVLLLLIFQPELRAAFMRLDSALRYWPRPPSALSESNRAIAEAMFELAHNRIGALVVIVRRDTILELLEGGVALGAEISSELLRALFQKDSPLHDGAVIIDGDQAVKAGVVLPLTQRQNVASFYGTRHRAGMGLAERCDALVVVVSEERGEVSLMLGRDVRLLAGPEQLRQELEELRHRDRMSPANCVYRILFADIKLKLGAVGLAGLIWSMSFLAAGTTIRSVSVPIEFSDVPVGMEISQQSTDELEVQLRGSPWVIDSISLGRQIARFDLGHLHAGWNTLQLAPNTLDLPPGVVVDRVTPGKVQVLITSTKPPVAPGG
jgi:diadenylate cyclase